MPHQAQTGQCFTEPLSREPGSRVGREERGARLGEARTPDKAPSQNNVSISCPFQT